MIKYYLIACILSGMLYTYQVCGQMNNYIDSLKRELARQPEMSLERVNILTSLQEAYAYNYADSSMMFGEEALRISKKIDFPEGIAASYQGLCVNYANRGELEKAEGYAVKELAIAKKHNLVTRILDAQNNIAAFKMIKGEHTKAKGIYLEMLIIADSLERWDSKAYSLMNLGEIYFALHDYEQSLSQFLESRKIASEIGTIPDIEATVTTRIGKVLTSLGRYDESMKYLEQARILYENRNSQRGVADAMLRMGNNYLMMDSLILAEQIIREVDTLSRKWQLGVVDAKLGFDYGLLYLKKKEYGKALHHLELYLPLALKHGIKHRVIETYQYLSASHKGLGNFSKALDYSEKAYNLRDSVLNHDVINKLTELQKEYELTIRQNKINNLEQERHLQKLALANVENRTYLMAGGIAILLIVVVLLTAGFRIKSRFTTELKEKYEEIKVQNEMIESINIDLKAQALRAQMNPHFIFNSLNSIQYLIMKGEMKSAQHYMNTFSLLLRGIVNNSEKKWVTVKEEIETLKLYTKLESLRFGEEFDCQIVWDETSVTGQQDDMIPAMMVQPFIENSIIHGLGSKTGLKRLMVKFTKESTGKITCTIKDNGIGRVASNKMKSTGIKIHESKGLKLVEQRLKVLDNITKSSYRLEIIDLVDSDKGALGTEVLLEFPKATRST